MPGFFLSLLILFMMVSSGCNNPSGGSVIRRGNAPFLKAPAAFKFTQIRAKDGNVTLIWSESKRVAEYKVYMGTSTSAVTTPVPACTGLTRNCSITGLDPNTLYYFNVISRNDAGSKNISALGPALSVSSFDITSSTMADGSITLSWSNSTNATKYNLVYGFGSGSYSNTVTNVTSPYTLTGLANYRAHYFRVVALNGSNGYALSTSEGTETPIGPPTAPTGVSLAATPGNINVSWNLSSGATFYRVLRGTASGSLTEIATTASSTYLDSTVTDGTTYYYAIVAGNALYDSVRSAEEAARPITNFNMTSVTASSVANALDVAWPSTTGATTYNIRYGTNSANLTSQVTGVTSPYTLTGLTGGATYYVRVEAENSVGDGTSLNSSNQLSAVPFRALAAPTGLTATFTSGQVALSWSPVSGASSYEVLRGTVSGTHASLQSGILGTTYTDTSVVAGTTYYYVVRANNGLYGPKSSEVLKRPIGGFTISSVTPASATSLQISWGAAAGGDAYDVLFGTSSGSYPSSRLNVTSPYTLTGLAANTTYYIIVRAKNSVGTGANLLSAQSSGKTKTNAPSGLVATASPSNVSLNWTDTAGASSYNVYRGTVSGTHSLLASGLTSSDYNDTPVTDGTTYYYVVTASNGSESANSVEVATRSISSFSITGTSSSSPTEITISWGAATGATSYDIRYGTSSGSYTTTVANKTSPATLSGLTAGTTYYFRVVAKNSIGAGSSLNSSNEMSQGTPVGPPAGVVATVSTGRITLSWTAMSGASSYKVYRGTTSGTYALLASGVTTTTYLDNTVSDGTTYYYVLKSFNGADSTDSAEVSGKPITPFALTSVTAPSTTSMVATFPTTTGADAYDVKYGTTSGSYSTTVANATSPRTITGLSPNTTYYVVAVGRNAIGSGASQTTAELSVRTPTAAPSGLVAASSPGQVNLSWSSVTGATNYRVYRGTTSGTLSLLASGVATNSYSDATAVNGTTYYYAVAAFNGSESARSSEVATQPIANFTITSATQSSSTIGVTWSTVTGATSYDVLWGTSTGSYSGSAVGVTSPYTISGLTANTTYYVAVRAKNAVGTGTQLNSTESSTKTATATPAGLTASATPGQVGLNWTAVTGATSYKVYRGTTSGSLALLASGVASNAYLDTTVNNGTDYFYTVVAHNGSDSAASSEVSVRPISSFSLSSATPASATTIDLTWAAATGADSYDVRYGTSTGVYIGTVSNVTSPYTLTGLSPNTTYFIVIQAKNTVGAGTQVNSNERSATTATSAPTGLLATATTSEAVLTWNATSGASSYKVYRGTVSGTYAILASGVTSTSYTDTTVTNGTTYFYVVKAVNGIDSADSNETSALPIAAFAISSTSAPTISTIEVTWPATSGASTYNVKYGTTSGSYTSTATNVTSPYTISALASGTTYYIVVEAKNTIGGGATATTAEVSRITPIGPPTGLTASASPGSIGLSWTAAGGASSYKVYRGTTSGSYSLLASGVTGTTYTDNTAANGTAYYYVLKSFNGSDSADSSEVSAKPIANFSIASTTSPTPSSVDVTWSAVTGADSYDILYGTSTGTYTTTLTGVSSPATITGLAAGTTYYIVVRAKNAVGSGTNVNSTEASQLTALNGPTGLTASASPGQVGLNWTAVTGATNYKVYRGTTSGTLSLLASGVASNAYLDTTVTNGTTYFYAVLAYNGSDSPLSSEVSVRPIGSFTLTAATPASESSVTLTWGAATGAASYDIRYGTATGVYLFTVTNVTSSYTVTGLSANTQYFFSVRAKNSIGAGTYVDSNERNATTATAAPTTLAASATTGQIDLSWTAASGASSYRIYRGTSSGIYSQLATGITSTTYTDTTVSNGTQYFYVVRSFNGIESADSNEATGQTIAAFSIASTSAPTSSTLEVTWPATAGASTYDVRYGTTSGTYTTVSGVTSPYTITGLAGGTTYYVVVRANNAIGSGSSAQTSEVSQVTPVSAPTGLAASATPGQVNLTWNAVTGASSYKIYRGTVSGTYAEIATGVATTSYSDGTVANGTTYFYIVKAFNGADSAASNEVTIRPIAAFTSVIATTLDDTTIELSWPAVTGAASYDIRYGTSSGTYTTTLSNQTSPVSITGLSSGSTYYFVVDAKNSVGAGTTSTAAEIGATTAFGAPSGLVASATPGTVSLTWTAVAGASSYKVLRGTASGTYAEIASSVGTNSYVDNPVTDGTTYFYVVRAYNGTDSANSNEATVRSISSFTLASATPASSTSVTLTWGTATGAATYDVRYGTSSGVYTQTATNVTSPYTLSGLTAGTTYYVSIRAKNAIGAGTNYDSNQLSVLTSPAAPGSFAATATTGQIALSWATVSSATSYTVYRGTVSGSYASLTTGITALTYTDATVTNGTQYYYVVRADNGTESTNSNEATGMSIAAFSITSTAAPTTSTIEVTWPATSGASVYDVRYGTSSGSYATTLSGVTSPYTITGLTGGTNYYIVVRARNTIGSGSSATTAEVAQVTPLSAPSGLTAASTPGQVDLSWTGVTGASSYKVYRGTVSGTHSLLASGVTTNSYTDSTAVNGTQYYYVVKSFNGADSANSNEATTLPMANFSISSTTSPSSSSVEVTWTGPTGSSSFDIKYGTATGSYSTTTTGVTSPYTITGLTANTTYYIRVIAKNAIGAGTTLDSAEEDQLTATAAPTGLTAAATPGQVDLSWSAVTGATTYSIYRGTVSGTRTLLASAIATTTYSDTTVNDGTTYYYSVRAQNGADSADSSEVAVQSISNFNFSAATAASSTSLDLTWDAATGAASYDVHYGTTAGTYTGTVTNVTSPYSLTGLTAATTYFIVIKAKNAVGAGTTLDSNERSALTSTAAPSGLTAAATTGQIALSWTAATGATNYNVYRGTASGTYTSLATLVSGTTYTDSTVTNGTQYFYVVRANNGTESANSNEATGLPIAGFSISGTSAPTASTIEVTWPATSGASAYDVRYGTSSGSYSTTVTNVTSPYTITGLTGNTNYYIVIRATNAIGAGSSATTAEVTQITPLGAPTGLAASSVPGEVDLTWNTVSGASSYKVYRGTASGTYSLLASGVASTSYSDTTVTNGTQYFYVVKAYNGADSADSNEATTLPLANWSITATASPSSSSVDVTWTGPTGSSSFDIKYGTATGSYSTTLTGVTSPYTITGLAAGTTYYIRVIARNAIGSGTSVDSAEATQLTALGAPTGLAAAATPSQVNLSWNSMTGASSYKVYRGTTSGTLSLLASGVATASYTDSTVTNGTTYFYAVRAFNGSDSADSSEVSIRPISTFSVTSVTATSDSTIDVTWGAATGAASYDVRYGTTSGVYLATLTGVTSTYTITGLSSDTLYYVSVQAKNAIGAGTTVNSNEMNDRTATGAPTNLAATASPGNVGLTWTAVTGATSYNVYRGTVSGTYSQIATGVTSAGYSDTTVTDGTTYYYAVSATNGIESALSSEVSIKPISSFTLTAANVQSAASVELTWGTATGADAYDVQYGTSSGIYLTTVSNVTSSYTLTGLSAATLYYVSIKARNAQGAGTELDSNELTFTTSTAAPAGLAAAVATGQINLTWSASSGATNYNVYRGTSTGVYSQIASAVSATNYADTSVTDGTQYYYMVRSFNGSESADSNEATGLPIASFSIASTTAPSATTIEVTWAAAGGAATYDVRYGTATGTYSTTSAGVTSPHTITGLTAGTTYYITVRANNSVGSGTQTSTPEVTQVTPLAAPTGLVATGGTSKVDLSWTAVTGATSYKIFRGTTSGSLTEIASGISSTTYSDTSVTDGTTYYFAVKTYNGADSALSAEVSSLPTAMPVISSITSSSKSSLTVSWGAAAGAATYDLKYGATSGSYTTTFTGVTSPYTITGLTEGSTYYVQIVAKNAVGTGTTVNSVEASGTTNFAPVLSTITDQIMQADTSHVVNFTVSDSNDVLTCAGAMTGSSSDTALVPNANIVFSGTVPNCSATITPTASTAGAATITFTASDTKDTTAVNFGLTVTPCTVATINWETQPTGMAAGSLFGTAPRVSLRKLDGTLCTSNTAPVALFVSYDPTEQQDATVTGVASVTPSGGYAHFTGARMERAGTGFTIAAAQGTIQSLPSSAFSVTALAASKIAFYQQPLTSDPNSVIIPAPSVRTTDIFGNYVAASGINISLSLMDNTEAATLSGTTIVATDASGIASFSNLSIDQLGSYYLLATPDNGWSTINSDVFDIIVITPQDTMATIEMVNGPITHPSNRADYLRSSTSIGTNYIDGTTTYTWKVIATNTNNGQDTILRLRNGTTNVTSVTVNKRTTTPTLYSISIPNSSITANGNWNLRAEMGTATIYSSRIVVKQVGAKRSQIYIPLNSIENASTSGYVSSSSSVHSTTSGLHFPTYSWNSAEFDNINGITFQATGYTSAGSICAALYNKSTGTQIGGEVCSTSTIENTFSINIPKTSMPATAELEARFRAQGGGTAYLFKAGLYVRLVNVVKMKAIQRVAGAAASLIATTNFVEQRASSYISNYGTGLVSEILSCRGRANTSGSGSFIYKNHGSNTSGTTSSSTISASTITYSTQSSFTTLEAGPIVTTNGNNQYMNYTHSSGDFALAHCLYSAEISY